MNLFLGRGKSEKKSFNGTPFQNYVMKDNFETNNSVKPEWSTDALLKAVDTGKNLEHNLELGQEYVIDSTTAAVLQIPQEKTTLKAQGGKLISAHRFPQPASSNTDAFLENDVGPSGDRKRPSDIFDEEESPPMKIPLRTEAYPSQIPLTSQPLEGL
jgi:hypothetical protein